MRLDIVSRLEGRSLQPSEKEGGLPPVVYPSRRMRKSRHRHRSQGGQHRVGRAVVPEPPAIAQGALRPGPTEVSAKDAESLTPALTSEERALMAEFLSYLQARRSSGSLPGETGALEVYGQVAATRAPELADLPVSVIVGPCASLADMEALIDEIAEAPEFQVLFQAFQGGFYRLDGRTRALGELALWLAQRPAAESVAREGAALHVVPREPRA